MITKTKITIAICEKKNGGYSKTVWMLAQQMKLGIIFSSHLPSSGYLMVDYAIH